MDFFLSSVPYILNIIVAVYIFILQSNKDRKWADKHFLSHRALQHVHSVREQLSVLLKKVGVDITLSCWPEREPFLKCLLGGLFLNVAQRVSSHDIGGNSRGDASSSGMSKRELQEKKLALMQSNATGMNSSSVVSAGQGRFHFSSNNTLEGPGKMSGSLFTGKSQAAEDSAPYRTIKGRQPVHIHPSSVLFSMVNSRKLPEFVVYAELLITSKQYMRNIAVVDGAWLTELFPSMFRDTAAAAAATTAQQHHQR
jgi:hypothetical protein